MPPVEPPLRHYLRLLGPGLWIVAVVTAIAVGAAAAVTYTREPTYSAEMKLVVGQGGIVVQPGSDSAETLTQTASALLESDIVASTVTRDLNLSIEPDELLDNLEVTSEPQSAVLNVTYESPDRRQSVAVLEEIGVTFPEILTSRLTGSTLGPPSELSPNSSSREMESRITATVFDPARLEPGQASPQPVRNLVIAGIVGIVFGLLLVVLREGLSPAQARR